MTTTITERDKKLLYFCGIAVFLFFFVRFLRSEEHTSELQSQR